MKKVFSIILLSTSFQAIADTVYLGADYMLSDIEISNEYAKPSAAILRAGVSNNNMAFEAQYLLSGGSDNIYNTGLELEKSLALYFVMQSDIVNGFGLDVSLGYAKNDLKITSTNSEIASNYKYNGFSWRIDIHQEIPYIENTSIRIGYQSLYKGDDIEITGLSLGFTYKF